MATGTFQTYAKFVTHVLKSDIDLDTASFMCMLVDSTYVPNLSTDEFVSLIRADEVTGSNWTANGQAVTLTVTEDDATDEVRVEISDISVATVTLTDGKHAVVYNDTPATDATKHLVGYVTFDTALAPTAGTLAITFPAPTFKFSL